MNATRILVTGANGFVGGRLVPRLTERHEVVALSRRPVAGVRCCIGSFASAEDLRQLDDLTFDVAIHLAAALGGAGEEEAMATNVAGTRCLLRHLGDRRCRKVVLASSIAAAGCLDPGFVPLGLPIADRHPCLAVDAYGLSKHLMEQIADYFARVFPELEIVSLRIGSIVDKPGNEGRWGSVAPPPSRPFLLFGQVAVDDVVDAIMAVAGAPVRPGARVYNLVAPDVRSRDAVADVLRAALGERARSLPLSAYETAGRHSPPVYAIGALRADYGYAPTRSLAA